VVSSVPAKFVQERGRHVIFVCSRASGTQRDTYHAYDNYSNTIPLIWLCHNSPIFCVQAFARRLLPYVAGRMRCAHAEVTFRCGVLSEVPQYAIARFLH